MNKEIKQKSLPWKMKLSERGYLIEDNKGIIITDFNSSDKNKVKLICLAVNSYYKNQERIKELEEAGKMILAGYNYQGKTSIGFQYLQTGLSKMEQLLSK